MKGSKIAIRYAKALLEYASEKKSEDILYEEMNTLEDSFLKEPSLQAALENPTVSAENKRRLLKIAGGIDTSDAFNAFVQLVSDNKREVYGVSIAKQYRELYRRKKGIVTAKLTAVRPLSPDATRMLKEIIIGGASEKSVEFAEVTDPAIIGGFILDVDFKRLDASIKNQLRLMKKYLTE